MNNNKQINIFQQLEQYKEQHPDFAETMLAFREVQAIYMETMQIMREAELALHSTIIYISSDTEITKWSTQ